MNNMVIIYILKKMERKMNKEQLTSYKVTSSTTERGS